MTISRRVFERYKLAAIPVPPRKLGEMLKRVESKLAQTAKRFRTLWDAFERAEREANDVSYVLRQFDFEMFELEFAVGQAATVADRASSPIQWVLLDKSKLSFLLDRLKDIRENDMHRLIALSKKTDADVDNARDGTSFPQEMAVQLKEMIDCAQQIVSAIESATKSCANAVAFAENLSQAGWGVTSPLPKHEKVETLYHASIKARELYERGFSQSRPEGSGLGLGGSVEDKAGNEAVSFTYDLKYAAEIARWFKEMAMVAHGQIKASQILSWADHEGVADETLEHFASLWGATNDVTSTIKGIHSLTRRGGKWFVILETFDRTRNENVESPGDIDTIIRDKRRLFGLYESFMYANKHRENVASMNTGDLLERLERENVSPRDIGVVFAEVDMTDPDITHLPAERELRVPPRAIRKVLKFV